DKYLFSLRHQTTATLFPYTTLFRSTRPSVCDSSVSGKTIFEITKAPGAAISEAAISCGAMLSPARSPILAYTMRTPPAMQARLRSEEHTSELQSRENLVCRLLLVKK